jgi:hypothetical protein
LGDNARHVAEPFPTMRLSASRSCAAATFAASLLALAACTPRFDWRELASTGGGYVAAFPAKPSQATRSVAVDGVQIALTMQSAMAGDALFAVGFADLPPAIAADPVRAQALATALQAQMVKNIAGVAVQRTSPVLARPTGDARALVVARAVTAHGQLDGAPAVLHARFFVVGARLYEAIALGPVAQLPDEAAETFLSSLRLGP